MAKSFFRIFSFYINPFIFHPHKLTLLISTGTPFICKMNARFNLCPEMILTTRVDDNNEAYVDNNEHKLIHKLMSMTIQSQAIESCIKYGFAYDGTVKQNAEFSLFQINYAFYQRGLFDMAPALDLALNLSISFTTFQKLIRTYLYLSINCKVHGKI